MSSPKKPKNSLWYKYQDNDPSRIRIETQLPSLEDEPSVSDIIKEIVKEYTTLEAGNVTLRVKRPMDVDYEELNEALFNNCGNNYVTLKDNYGITKDNPIKIGRAHV